MTGAGSEIDFLGSNIPRRKQNCEVGEGRYNVLRYCPLHRYQYQTKCQTRNTDRLTKFCRASKYWHATSEQAKEQHTCEQQEDNLAIDIVSQMSHKLMETESAHLARSRNENWTNANYFNLDANSINSHLNCETGSHMLGAQVIARSDTANKDTIGITNLIF
ncbi:MAG: hypothetical protein EZS28_039105 [Streblomastix strix]|uniref:Uncharacterized protein n=1 Tax=Streblomastix strix TaxID=222440 RepID=A0A5J4U4W8_9EUKA|nr:MAG: hypothetical protein EZS28_039105 [Streblomastix strix]